MATTKCKGKRRGFRKGAFGTFGCTRAAKGEVETQVGFTERHPCCGSEECISSIRNGYPASWVPYTK